MTHVWIKCKDFSLSTDLSSCRIISLCSLIPLKKIKSRVRPRTGLKAQRGIRHSSTISLTSALNPGGWSAPLPGRFTAGKETRHPLYRWLGGLQDRSGWER
jgi:hypothetical protein